MKSILPITIFVFMVGLVLPMTAQTTPGSVEYMSDLVTPIEETKAATLKYLQSITKGRGAARVESKRKALVTETKAVLTDLKKKKGFDGKEALKNSLTEFLNIKLAVLEEDYEKIVNMDKIKEQSYDAMEAYIRAQEAANEKLDGAFEIVKKAQNEFATKHSIILEQREGDEIDKKIAKASKVLSHFNEVYLIFFRSYLQEGYVLEALGSEDVAAIEQGRNALESYAKEGLKKLETLEDYEKDSSLKDLAKNLLEFYLKEAEGDFTKQIDFLLSQDDLVKLRKAAEKSRKKEEINAYNEKVEAINEEADRLNKITQSSNNNREKLLDQWNKTSEKFLSTHSE